MNQLETVKLYDKINSTRVELNEIGSLSELISQQCARTPDSIAVVWENQQLTYTQLDALSDQIAERLFAQGITSGCLLVFAAPGNSICRPCLSVF